ncbi:hypothetical protein G6L15_06810 [Agrobacterium rhizogenes]|uniref:hypothetical protein n=1 Tax=Rhizobium rhizogenes TaxID=359 RepID=UPI0015728465|nr:hypothetical protein [Rhizobium rhizogenes]NTG85857.1 hypothetical protein [Rhizobium rhizogenes]
MLVRLTTGVVGDRFFFDAGAEVDSDELSSFVGTGWEAMCEPLDAQLPKSVVRNAQVAKKGRNR